MDEQWKPITGYERLYEVSDHGRIRNIRTGRVKANELDKNGYERIQLCRGNRDHKKYFVHRLVALAFVDGYFEGAQVNHIDMNRSNNTALNLEWVTNSQNQKHAIVTRGKLPNHFIKVPYDLIDSEGNITHFDCMTSLTNSLNRTESWGRNIVKYKNGFSRRLNVNIVKGESNE